MTASLCLHSHPGTGSCFLGGSLHIQKAGADHSTDHGHHLQGAADKCNLNTIPSLLLGVAAFACRVHTYQVIQVAITDEKTVD